jgi:hypothetical protein
MICRESDLPRLIPVKVPTGRIPEAAAQAIASLLLDHVEAREQSHVDANVEGERIRE